MTFLVFEVMLDKVDPPWSWLIICQRHLISCIFVEDGKGFTIISEFAEVEINGMFCSECLIIPCLSEAPVVELIEFGGYIAGQVDEEFFLEVDD